MVTGYALELTVHKTRNGVRAHIEKQKRYTHVRNCHRVRSLAFLNTKCHTFYVFCVLSTGCLVEACNKFDLARDYLREHERNIQASLFVLSLLPSPSNIERSPLNV